MIYFKSEFIMFLMCFNVLTKIIVLFLNKYLLREINLCLVFVFILFHIHPGNVVYQWDLKSFDNKLIVY